MTRKITPETIQEFVSMLDKDDDWHDRLGNLSDYLDEARTYIKYLLHKVSCLEMVKATAEDFASRCKETYCCLPGEYDTFINAIVESKK